MVEIFIIIMIWSLQCFVAGRFPGPFTKPTLDYSSTLHYTYSWHVEISVVVCIVATLLRCPVTIASSPGGGMHSFAWTPPGPSGAPFSAPLFG